MYIEDKQGILFKFGKFNNCYLHDIDDGYLIWMIKQHAEKKNFSEDLIVEIESELKSRGYKIKDLI